MARRNYLGHYEIVRQRGLASGREHYAIYDKRKGNFVSDIFTETLHFDSYEDAEMFIQNNFMK